MFRINLLEKLKIIFHFGKNSKNEKGLFIAAKKLVNNGVIESDGYKNNVIISDDMVSNGKISFKK